MTHGFDDQGAQFDAKGNLHNWWTKEDLLRFKSATQCIINQFSTYKVDKLSVQGALVVGEATADLGGLLLAYHALHASNNFKNAKDIDGFTPDQQFFISAAHTWGMNIRPEKAQQLITIDPHPPARYRVNGSMRNIPAFQQSFTKPTSPKIQNSQRCVIW